MTSFKSAIRPFLLLLPLVFLSCNVLFHDQTGTAVVNHEKVVSFTPVVPDDNEQVLTLFAVGDAGSGGENQKRVANAMARVATSYKPAGVLFLGDNFYEFGVYGTSDNKWKNAFEDMYDDSILAIPFFPVLGNHDIVLNAMAQVEYSQLSDRWTMPARYYEKKLAIQPGDSVQIIGLDTNFLTEESSAEALNQYQWLDSVFAGKNYSHRIVFGHHPVYSGGSHSDQPTLIANLHPRLARAGVDIYVAGHDHHLEVRNPVDSVWYLVSGAGGKSRNARWTSNTKFAATNLGFMAIRMTKTRLWADVFNADGSLIFSDERK